MKVMKITYSTEGEIRLQTDNLKINNGKGLNKVPFLIIIIIMTGLNSEIKKNIRILHKKIRESLDIENLSRIIIRKLTDLPEFKNAESVFSYVSFGSEINTSEILKRTDKKIFVPKITNDEMCMTLYTPDSLIKGKFGICEPCECIPCFPQKNDVVICPALGCDYNFYRLGYGKGFYDRFLSKYECIKILPIPSCLICDDVGHDSFDVSMDIVLTEKAVFRRK